MSHAANPGHRRTASTTARQLLSDQFNRMRLAYYRAAIRVIDPLHEDVPAIVLTIRYLEDITP